MKNTSLTQSSGQAAPWARRALLGLVATSALATSQAAESTPLAQVGDTQIRIEDIRPYLEKLGLREQAALQANPQLLTQYVRTVLVQQLLLKEALAKNWDKQAAVAAEAERARENAIAESFLQSVSQVPADFPAEDDIQKAYEANKASLLVPKQFRLAQIFIAAPQASDKAASDKALARVAAVKETLRKGDFAAVAKAESDEKASADRGGEIGWLTEAQIQPEIRTKIAGLTKDQISEAIRLNDGWHFIKVVEIKEPFTPTLDQVKGQIVQQLRAARAKANGEAYLAGLLQKNRVAINEIALAELLQKSAK
jgi:parvulin-like peptidyl-prolyl isomerase